MHTLNCDLYVYLILTHSSAAYIKQIRNKPNASMHVSGHTCSTVVSLSFNRFQLFYNVFPTEHNFVMTFMVHATEINVKIRQGIILLSKKHCSSVFIQK